MSRNDYKQNLETRDGQLSIFFIEVASIKERKIKTILLSSVYFKNVKLDIDLDFLISEVARKSRRVFHHPTENFLKNQVTNGKTEIYTQ